MTKEFHLTESRYFQFRWGAFHQAPLQLRAHHKYPVRPPVHGIRDENGQALIVHSAAREFLVVGYRSDVSLWNDVFRWPALKQVHAEKGS